MKKRNVIFLVNIVIIVVLVIVVFVTGLGKNEKSKVPDLGTNENIEDIGNVEEIYEEIINGKKTNISEKFHEEKILGNLIVENVNLTYENGKSTMVLFLKNVANNTVGDYEANIILKDKNGKNIESMEIYINHIEAGKTASVVVNITKDIVGSYDYEIVR